jgi:hypothetical protein
VSESIIYAYAYDRSLLADSLSSSHLDQYRELRRKSRSCGRTGKAEGEIGESEVQELKLRSYAEES